MPGGTSLRGAKIADHSGFCLLRQERHCYLQIDLYTKHQSYGPNKPGRDSFTHMYTREAFTLHSEMKTSQTTSTCDPEGIYSLSHWFSDNRSSHFPITA